jgi:hypothetical protein
MGIPAIRMNTGSWEGKEPRLLSECKTGRGIYRPRCHKVGDRQYGWMFEGSWKRGWHFALEITIHRPISIILRKYTKPYFVTRNGIKPDTGNFAGLFAINTKGADMPISFRQKNILWWRGKYTIRITDYDRIAKTCAMRILPVKCFTGMEGKTPKPLYPRVMRCWEKRLWGLNGRFIFNFIKKFFLIFLQC